MSDNDKLYVKWLNHVFNQPTTDPQWYYNESSEEFQSSSTDLVYLIGRTCEQSGTDLIQFSDAQVNDGLCYIFFPSASNVVYSLINGDVEEQARIDAVRRMKILYRDCLAKRCAPVLSARNEPSQNPLSYFCYMLWDVSPLAGWKDVVLEVMEAALYLPNPACIESGLHGLGHRCYQSQDKVIAIIDKLLSISQGMSPELRQYAMNARTGYIQ